MVTPKSIKEGYILVKSNLYFTLLKKFINCKMWKVFFTSSVVYELAEIFI